MGLDRKLSLLEIVGEGCCVIPFGFTINATTDPDGVVGDHIVSFTRSEAGEFVGTLVTGQRPYACFVGLAAVSVIADDTDVLCEVDWSDVATLGTFTVRTMTGAVQTDPTDNLLVGGFLLCKKTDRAATRP